MAKNLWLLFTKKDGNLPKKTIFYNEALAKAQRKNFEELGYSVCLEQFVFEREVQ